MTVLTNPCHFPQKDKFKAQAVLIFIYAKIYISSEDKMWHNENYCDKCVPQHDKILPEAVSCSSTLRDILLYSSVF